MYSLMIKDPDLLTAERCDVFFTEGVGPCLYSVYSYMGYAAFLLMYNTISLLILLFRSWGLS